MRYVALIFFKETTFIHNAEQRIFSTLLAFLGKSRLSEARMVATTENRQTQYKSVEFVKKWSCKEICQCAVSASLCDAAITFCLNKNQCMDRETCQLLLKRLQTVQQCQKNPSFSTPVFLTDISKPHGKLPISSTSRKVSLALRIFFKQEILFQAIKSLR